MNGMLATLLLDGDTASQVRSESIHLAFLAIAGGGSLVLSSFTAVISWFVRNALKRSEADKAAIAGAVVELGKKVDANKDRHGYEIADTRIAVAPLFAKAGLDQPNYPSR